MLNSKIKLYIKIILVIILIIYYLFHSVFLILTSVDSKKYVGGDFGVFYAAGKMFLEKRPLYNNGANNYIRNVKEVPQDFQTGSRYIYPPVFALFFSSFTFLELKLASQIWFFLNQILIILALYLLIKMAKPINSKLSFNDYVLGLFVLDLYFPILKVFKTGQIDIFLFLLFVLILFCIINNKEKLGSLLTAVFSLVKPFYLLAPFYLLLKKKYKFFIYIILTVLAINLIAVLVSGKQNNITYYTKVLPNLSIGGVSANFAKTGNSTINGFIYRNFHKNENMLVLAKFKNEILKYISLSTRIIILGIVIFLILYKNNIFCKEIILLEFSLLILSFFLLQNYIHLQYLIFLLIPVVCLWYNKLVQKNRFYLVLILISFLLLGYNEKFAVFLKPNIGLTLIFDLRIYGGILLLGLLMRVLYLEKKFFAIKNT